eukprot:2247702-Rhodomonas_salina.1
MSASRRKQIQTGPRRRKNGVGVCDGEDAPQRAPRRSRTSHVSIAAHSIATQLHAQSYRLLTSGRGERDSGERGEVREEGKRGREGGKRGMRGEIGKE